LLKIQDNHLVEKQRAPAIADNIEKEAHVEL